MAEERAARPERRVSAPLVLAIASAMISVGVISWLATRPREPEPSAQMPGEAEVLVDRSAPALAAESFLDAWRKRAHGTAIALSTGPAKEAVLAREAVDARMSPQDRAEKQRIWDSLAEHRLRLLVDESEELDDGRVVIRGEAQGEFLERPYAREAVFVVRRVGDGWLVEDMQLGEILSDTPDFLEIDPSVGRDPSEFEVRGEDVP